MSWKLALYLLPGLVIGITIHEAAHALSAKWLGDACAQRMGRVSLNPLRHLSAAGILVLFFLGFGWGKPVQVNLYNFKRPKLDYLLCSLAGPLSNMIVCALSLGILYIFPHRITWYMLGGVFVINGILAAVNLIPIPPLDGSKIWPCVIPNMRPTISAKWGKIWLLVLLIGFFTGAIDEILGPVVNFLYSLLPAG